MSMFARSAWSDANGAGCCDRPPKAFFGLVNELLTLQRSLFYRNDRRRVMGSIFGVALNAALTLFGADPIDLSDDSTSVFSDSDGPDPGTIGPGMEPGTTNGGD